MISMITTGAVLGLSAGISPGPLLTLVITETLRRGIGAGIRVALAPLITDLPIILISLLVLSRLARFQTVLGYISLFGAGLVLYLGLENFRAKRLDVDTAPDQNRSLAKGVAVNLISPHPYLFWFSVGGPLFLKALNQNVMSGILFVGGFYVLLVGSKVGIALLVNRSRSFVSEKPYRFLMQVLGAVLIGFSVLLARDGLVLLQWIS